MTNTPIQPIISGAMDNAPDGALLAAFDRRNDALVAVLKAQKKGDRAAEDAQWSLVTLAEKELVAMTAISAKGAAAQLWTALFNSLYGNEFDAALIACNLPTLEANANKVDWDAQLMIAALRSLTAIIAASEGESAQ